MNKKSETALLLVPFLIFILWSKGIHLACVNSAISQPSENNNITIIPNVRVDTKTRSLPRLLYVSTDADKTFINFDLVIYSKKSGNIDISADSFILNGEPGSKYITSIQSTMDIHWYYDSDQKTEKKVPCQKVVVMFKIDKKILTDSTLIVLETKIDDTTKFSSYIKIRRKFTVDLMKNIHY